MTQGDMATALDYVEALGAARRAKRWLSVAMLVVILGDLTIFFLIHVGRVPRAENGASPLADFLRTLIGLFQLLGVLIPILLAADLLLILNILLLGRLIGVSRIVSGFFWCVLLGAMLFPWQAFLSNQTFPIPGALYTWGELQARAVWVTTSLDWRDAFLRWSRFVGFPMIALVVLVVMHLKSTRGLKMAQGETKPLLSPPPGKIFDMREERGQIHGDQVISELYTLWGSIGGNVRVVEGGKFYMRGSIYGNIIIEHGGRAHIFGNVQGGVTVKRGAKLIHSGVVGGNMLNVGGRLHVELTARVHGDIKTKHGETTVEKSEPRTR